jgi:hypothetical protein
VVSFVAEKMRKLSIVAVVYLAACGDDADPARDASAGPRDGGSRDASCACDAAGDSGSLDAAGSDAGPPAERALPPENAGLDYQLGGAYPPPEGVAIVSRDRSASIAAGLYNVCYVNGFQSQPDEESFWLDDHPELVLRDDAGEPVIDEEWDEMLLDVRTETSRSALAEIVGAWIEGCATAGFDAVEIDNLDSYSRSGGRITEDHAVAFMRLLAGAAHRSGLAIAQKNSAEILSRRAEMDTDFAVAEECNRYDECADYTAAYGDAVLVIEYRRADFDAGCRDFPELSIVLRDVNLVTPGEGAYLYDGC